MYFFIFGFSLVLEVLLYRLFICVLSDSIHIISACTKFAAPKHTFHFGMEPENFLGRDALDRTDYHFRSVRRNTLDQKMNVVAIKTYLQKMNLVPLLYTNTKTNLLERRRNVITKYISPIFDWTNKMIKQQALVMPLVNVITHNHKSTYQDATPRQSLEEFY